MITTKPYKPVSDKDSDLQLAMSDFPGEQDSEILVRERARGTKLDGLYKKKETKPETPSADKQEARRNSKISPETPRRKKFRSQTPKEYKRIANCSKLLETDSESDTEPKKKSPVPFSEKATVEIKEEAQAKETTSGECSRLSQGVEEVAGQEGNPEDRPPVITISSDAED